MTGEEKPTEAAIVDVTITAPDAEWLRRHCALLVEQRLGASANVFPNVESVYRWDGQIHNAAEAYAIIHTQPDRVARIIELTNANHPYDTVHILTSPITQADPRYRRWVIESTSSESGTGDPDS